MARRPLTVPFEPTRHLREDPWAIKLALDVIEFDFGVFTKNVADGLVALGRPTVQDVVVWLNAKVASEVSLMKKTRAALVVLLTHGCVAVSTTRTGIRAGKQVTESSGPDQPRFLTDMTSSGIAALVGSSSGYDAELSGGGGGSGAGAGAGALGLAAADDDESFGPLRYSLDAHRTLSRLRHPHFLAVAQRLFGAAGVAIAQTLLLRGPWTRSPILAVAGRMLAREREGLPFSPDYSNTHGPPGASPAGGASAASAAGASASSSGSGAGASAAAAAGSSSSAGAGAGSRSSGSGAAAKDSHGFAQPPSNLHRKRSRSTGSDDGAASGAGSGSARGGGAGGLRRSSSNASAAASAAAAGSGASRHDEDDVDFTAEIGSSSSAASSAAGKAGAHAGGSGSASGAAGAEYSSFDREHDASEGYGDRDDAAAAEDGTAAGEEEAEPSAYELEESRKLVEAAWGRMVAEQFIVPSPGLAVYALPRQLRAAALLRAKPELAAVMGLKVRGTADSSSGAGAGAGGSRSGSGGSAAGGSVGAPGSLLAAAAAAADAADDADEVQVSDDAGAGGGKAGSGSDSDSDDDDDDADSGSGSGSEDSDAGFGRKRKRAGGKGKAAAGKGAKGKAAAAAAAKGGKGGKAAAAKGKGKGKDSKEPAAKRARKGVIADSDDEDAEAGAGAGAGAATAKAPAKGGKGKPAAAAASRSASASVVGSAARSRFGLDADGASSGAGAGGSGSGGTAVGSGGADAEADDADSGVVWAFGVDAANRRLRNDLVLRHVKSCAMMLLQAVNNHMSGIASAGGGGPASGAGASSAGGAGGGSSSLHAGIAALSTLPLAALEDLAVKAVDTIMLESSTGAGGRGEAGVSSARSAALPISTIASIIASKYKSVPGVAASGRITPTGGASASRAGSPGAAGGVAASPATIYAVLHLLGRMPTGPVAEENASANAIGERRFAVPYRDVLTLLQLRTVESAVAGKNIELAAQALRLLLYRGPLDEKHMSDLLMVPQREARAVAFQLMQRGYVDLQEVPKRPDHHPQFTFYTFAANWDSLLRAIVEESHHAAFNLRRRWHMEIARLRAAQEAYGAGTFSLPAPALALLRVQGLADHKRRVEAGEAEEGSFDDSPAGLHRLALDKLEEAPQRLQMGCLRLEHTLLLLRDLHFTSVARVTGRDVLEVEARSRK